MLMICVLIQKGLHGMGKSQPKAGTHVRAEDVVVGRGLCGFACVFIRKHRRAEQETHPSVV